MLLSSLFVPALFAVVSLSCTGVSFRLLVWLLGVEQSCQVLPTASGLAFRCPLLSLFLIRSFCALSILLLAPCFHALAPALFPVGVRFCFGVSVRFGSRSGLVSSSPVRFY